MRRYIYRYNLGKAIALDMNFKISSEKNHTEVLKKTNRGDVINYLSSKINEPITYLEIGVRNPADNFDKINATTKYSVDPGLEFKDNPVDFRLTSDAFFDQLRTGNILNPEIKFDIVFIDGLHLADQVYRDILNSLDFLSEIGFIILHDCNPPTEWHARETFEFENSPARGTWNGTTWKAFVKAKDELEINACCIDSDFGIGILSKTHILGNPVKVNNPFFEFKVFEENRTQSLNLIPFELFKSYFE